MIFEFWPSNMTNSYSWIGLKLIQCIVKAWCTLFFLYQNLGRHQPQLALFHQLHPLDNNLSLHKLWRELCYMRVHLHIQDTNIIPNHLWRIQTSCLHGDCRTGWLIECGSGCPFWLTTLSTCYWCVCWSRWSNSKWLDNGLTGILFTSPWCWKQTKEQHHCKLQKAGEDHKWEVTGRKECFQVGEPVGSHEGQQTSKKECMSLFQTVQKNHTVRLVICTGELHWRI